MIFFEIFTGGRYYRDMKILKILVSNSKRFRFYAIFKKWQIGAGCALADILNITFSLICLKQPLVLKTHQGVLYNSRNPKMTSKMS